MMIIFLIGRRISGTIFTTSTTNSTTIMKTYAKQIPKRMLNFIGNITKMPRAKPRTGAKIGRPYIPEEARPMMNSPKTGTSKILQTTQFLFYAKAADFDT